MDLSFETPEHDEAIRLIDLALREDFGEFGDITTDSLIGSDIEAKVNLMAREAATVAGGPVVALVFEAVDREVLVDVVRPDGAAVEEGDVIARLRGPLRSLLGGERTALNFVSHLSGIATQTRRFVERVSHTGARIYDTRKTLPGWRRLAKYAVRAGGGVNHRIGLFDAALIKDNHLAAWSAAAKGTIADAVRHCRDSVPSRTVEVEVDTIDQFHEAIEARPDIILLDNMSTVELRAAVEARNQTSPEVALEASGGIDATSIVAVAETGVDRISVGSLTHSVKSIDFGLDWDGR